VNEALAIHQASVQDVPTIAAQRRAMFQAMGCTDAAVLDAVQAASAQWTLRKMEAGEYRGWLVAAPSGERVAGAGLWLREKCSSRRNISGRQAYVMNLYTEPGHRRRGLARRLMGTVLAWCRQNGYAEITLHASDAGRPLYESLGFKPTAEMRLRTEG
jgi:GNAT superfamily N-acetyltransferase